MADIDVAGLENLDIAKQGVLQNNSTSNAPHVALLNLSPERLAQQELLDSIISEVNRVGTSIVPQSSIQLDTINNINDFNDNKETVNKLLNYYSLEMLNAKIDYEEFYEKTLEAQLLIDKPNGALLEMLFENEGGYNNVVKENKAFFDTLDYDNTLSLYKTYLQEKAGSDVFFGVESVSKESLDEVIDLNENPNPERLEELLEIAGGEGGLLRNAGIYRASVDGFYDQRKAMTLGSDDVLLDDITIGESHLGVDLSNINPDEVYKKELLDKIISEVNIAGSSIIPQSSIQYDNVGNINDFNNNKMAVNELLNYYSLEVLHGVIDHKEYHDKFYAAKSLIDNPNGALLEMMFENEGGYNSLAKENKAFLDTLDYDNTLNLYSSYLKEKNETDAVFGMKGVSKESLQELVELKKNPNPDRLEEILESFGGEDGLLKKAGSYRASSQAFAEEINQRKSNLESNSFDGLKDELSKFEIKKKDDVKLSNNSKLKI